MLLQIDKAENVIFFYMEDNKPITVIHGLATERSKTHELAKKLYADILKKKAAQASDQGEATGSVTEYDTKFLNDDLSKDDKKDVLFDALQDAIEGLALLSKQSERNTNASINEQLATGRCFVKDDILFIKETNGKESPVWFPTGNALEWQRDNGFLETKRANDIIGSVEKLRVLTESELKRMQGKKK